MTVRPALAGLAASLAILSSAAASAAGAPLETGRNYNNQLIQEIGETAMPGNRSEIASVEAVMREFERAVATRDPALAERILHPVWRAKRAARQGAGRIEMRADFLERLRDGGGPTASAPHLSSVQMCFGDFAIARTDNWASASGALHLLFKEKGAWRIAGEASAGADTGSRDGHFTPRGEEAAVLDVLGKYYRAVTDGDPATIKRIFAPFWEMKNHENEVVVTENKDTFVKRIESGPLDGYWDDRQIADVQIIAGRLAYVRVDRPSTPSTTIFIFMKISGTWLVIDKAWTDGRKAS